MAKQAENHMIDDHEFEELFRSMDEIKASDELKNATLDFIFAQDDSADDKDNTSTNHPHLVLVYDEQTSSDTSQLTIDDLDKDDQDRVGQDKEDQMPEGVDAVVRQPARTKHSTGWKLRIAAAIVAIVVAVGSGIAYALPTSHVLVTVDGTNFDLGVNVFGRTVTARADTDEGKEAILSSNVYHRGFRDSFDGLMEALEQKRGTKPSDMTFKVENQLGGKREDLERDASQVVEQYRRQPIAEPMALESPAQNPPVDEGAYNEGAPAYGEYGPISEGEPNGGGQVPAPNLGGPNGGDDAYDGGGVEDPGEHDGHGTDGESQPGNPAVSPSEDF